MSGSKPSSTDRSRATDRCADRDGDGGRQLRLRQDLRRARGSRHRRRNPDQDRADPQPRPLRRFRYDAKHDIVKCPRGKVLRPGKPVKHGRFFHSRSRDCSRCDLKAHCISKGRMTKSVVIGDHHPALLRARRQRERWSAEDDRLYQRHRWRSEGYHGEAKTWHGLARAVRRGLQNMRIQALLTAAAVNLKRLAGAILATLLAILAAIVDAIRGWAPCSARRLQCGRSRTLHARAAVGAEIFDTRRKWHYGSCAGFRRL